MIISKRVKKKNKAHLQTLSGHIEDSLKILKSYLENNEEVLRKYSDRWELDFDQFVNSIYLTVYFHDTGKVCEEFQRNIKEGKSSTKYPHALYSFDLLKGLDYSTILDTPVERLAILGHHTQLHTEIYGDLTTKHKPTYLKEEMKDFISNTEKYYQKLGFESLADYNPVVLEKISDYDDFELMLELRDFKSGQYEEENEKLKSIYTLILSILQTCDNYSSANFELYIKSSKKRDEKCYDSVLNNPKKFVPTLDLNDIRETILGDNQPYRFQKEILESCPKYSTIFAPCGRGKTEGALMWGLKALNKYDKSKIIFALPTQVTSNAMWERLCKLFGEGKTEKEQFQDGKDVVGLFHGKSFLKQKEKIEPEENIDPNDENFKGNVFFKPITITTIDHLMYSAVHGFSQADFAFGNIQNAVVIFDEAHYYETKTLEHLTAFYRLLKKLDIPHLLMSGTLPKFLTDEIGSFNDYKNFKDVNGLNNSPFKIKNTENKFINDDEVNMEVINEIIDYYNAREDIFVLLNTVEKSKKIYEKIGENMGDNEVERVILYHSRFTHQHRLEKEKKIEEFDESDEPFILVATQVIEISLDISSDKMYSEIAPPDAIGQRGGRLNRKGENWKNENEHLLKLFISENSLPYDDDLLKKTKNELEDFKGICDYNSIKKYCDRVYRDYELHSKTNLYGTSDDYFSRAILFGPPYFKITSPDERGKALKLRDENIRKIDVIPQSIFREKGEEALDIKNQVQIPYYRYKQYPDEFSEIEKNDKIYRLCDMEYTCEKGFEWDLNNKEKHNIL